MKFNIVLVVLIVIISFLIFINFHFSYGQSFIALSLTNFRIFINIVWVDILLNIFFVLCCLLAITFFSAYNSSRYIGFCVMVGIGLFIVLGGEFILYAAQKYVVNSYDTGFGANNEKNSFPYNKLFLFLSDFSLIIIFIFNNRPIKHD